VTVRLGDTPRVPRALAVVAALVVVVTTGMALLGGQTTGVSWDEPYHVERLTNYQDHGWYLSNNEMIDDGPGPWATSRYVYAPVAMLLIQGWAEIGGDGAAGVSSAAGAVADRHQAVVLLGLVCVAAVGVIGRVLFRSFGWGLVAASMLAAFPLWTGQEMFNIKDVPVATGYTLATLGLVLLGQRLSAVAAVTGFVSLTGGVILAVGTRPGIAPGIVAGSLVLLLFSAWRDRVQDLRTGRGLLCRLGVLVGSALAAWAALAAIYPRAFADPFSTLTNATEASSRFRGSGGARSYLPIHLLLDPPLLMVVLVLAGSALFFVRLRTMRTAGDELVGIAVVGAQAGAVPLAAVLSSAYLYNGLRQVLFVLPALAVLATYFVVELVRSTRRDADDRRALAVVVTLVSVALVLPVIGQARLFPYNYTQRGVLLEALGVTAELDYWRTSVRELASEVPLGGRVVCSPYWLDGNAQRFGFDGSHDCASDPVGPLSPYRGSRPDGPTLAPDEFYAVSALAQAPPPNCRLVGSVTRTVVLDPVRMSHVARCRLEFPVLGSGTTSFERFPERWGFLFDGWSPRPDGVGAALTGTEASLRFRLDPALRKAPIELTMAVDYAAGLEVLVDGEPVPLRRVGQSVGQEYVATLDRPSDEVVELTLTTDEPRAILRWLEAAPAG